MTLIRSEPMTFTDCTFSEFEPQIQVRVDALMAAERERIIQIIQREIDHAEVNETRLVPAFGRGRGDAAVRITSLEAALDAIRNLVTKSAPLQNPTPSPPPDTIGGNDWWK